MQTALEITAKVRTQSPPDISYDNDMDIFITFIIIALAAAYCGRTFYKKFRSGKGFGCSSGCSSCDTTASADCLSEIKNIQSTGAEK